MTRDDARGEEITALSSQVSSAFGELSRVQAELAERLKRFSEREAELEQQRAVLEKERDEHETRIARAERISRQAQAREEALATREEALDCREQAVRSFQDLLGRMAAALDDPTPTKLSEALDAATGSLRASQAARTARALTESDEVGDDERGEIATCDENQGVDLSDFSEDELHKLGLLQKLGTASTAEIAEQIRSERTGTSSKKRGWFS